MTNALTVDVQDYTSKTAKTVSSLDSLMADGGQVTLGAKADAAQADPTQTASLVALTKGTLKGVGQVADTVVADPTASGSLIALMKGKLKGIGQTSDTLATDTTSAWSLVALLKGALAALGFTSGAAVITDVNGTIQQYLRGLIKQWTASTLTFAGVGTAKPVSVTRPNDTAPYAANDVIGAATGSTAALQFANVGVSGAEVTVIGVELEVDASAVISGETSYRLYLYNVTPPSAYGDNAAWDLASGDRASFLGYVDLGTPIDLGSTLYVRTDGMQSPFKLSGTDLFGYLVTIGTYTPTAQRVYKVTPHFATI